MTTITLDEARRLLGRAGEAGVTTIEIDVTAWQADYAGGTGTILFKRPDGLVYPLTATVSGAKLTAVLSDVETAIPGVAYIEAQWRKDGKLVKSQLFDGVINKSIGDAGNTPASAPSWVEDIAATSAQIALGMAAVTADKETVAADKAAVASDKAAAVSAQTNAETARDAAVAAKSAAETAAATALENAKASGGLVSYQNGLNVKVTKHLNVWNQTKAQLASCYWTWVMRVDDKIADPLGKYYMWYSTDHAEDSAQYIGLAYSDSLTDGWTRYGNVFHHYSDTQNGYVGDECPAVIWDAENGKFLMFSSGTGDVGEAQSSYRSESVDGIAWTNTVKAFQNIDGTRLPGNLHNGYFMPFRLGGQWFGYSLLGGGNGGAALHWSEDGGYTWYTDHRQLGRWGLTGNDKWLYPNHSTVVTLMGIPYLLGIQSNFASGGGEKSARIVLTPLTDLRTPFGRPLVLIEPTDGSADYESANLRTLTAYAEGGKIYVYYNCKVGDDWFNNCAVLEPCETAAAAFVRITITAQPQAVSVTVGAVSGSLSVTAAASDASTITYQWYQNTVNENTGGTLLTGETGASMTIPTNLTDGTHYYYCVLTSATAGAKASATATVTASEAATVSISAQSGSASATEGSVTGSIGVTAAASDSSALTYQWYQNATNSATGGTQIEGETEASMAIPTTLTAGTYYYYCVVTSATAGTATSSAIPVVVAAAPTVAITGQPVDASVREGEITGSLSVTATGTTGYTLAYQWYQSDADENVGGTLLTGETGASMTIPTTLTAGTYYYYCYVSLRNAQNAEVDGQLSYPVTVTVTGEVFLANYDMLGTAAASVSSIADSTGNGNTLTATGAVVNSANGYPLIDASGKGLSIASPSLGAASRMKVHLKAAFASGMQTQNRLICIGNLHFQIAAAANYQGTNLRVEYAGTTTTLLYKSNVQTGGADNTLVNQASYRMIEMDITLTDTEDMTIVLKATQSDDNTYTENITVPRQTFAPLTELKTGAICLLNRADGTRFANGEVREFWIKG